MIIIKPTIFYSADRSIPIPFTECIRYGLRARVYIRNIDKSCSTIRNIVILSSCRPAGRLFRSHVLTRSARNIILYY